MGRRARAVSLPSVVAGATGRLRVRLAALLMLVLGSALSAVAQSTSGFTYNGIVYTSYQANEYLQTPQGPLGAAAMRATGANYASVMVTQYQQTYTSNTIAPETASTPGYISSQDSLSPTDAAVVAAIQNVQAQGLTVFLKPQVDSLDGRYRGTFAPTNPAAWFASYQTFILHYAKLASDNGVGGLVIGTELASLSKSTYLSYWTAIISQIRAQYPSLTLAYGANATYASDEFTTVSFWSQVDLMGVDGYFPLTGHADPTVAELVAAWTDNKDGLNIVQALKNVQSKYNKPMIFTELGYVSATGTNEAPYASAAPGTAYDPSEQQNCYEAFFEVFSQQTSWMKGVFWWAWSVSAPGTGDTGYTPQDKPAAMVTLPKWFGSTTQGFTIAPSNSTLHLGIGLSAPDTISVTYQGQYAGAVTLSATGLPAGVTAAVTPGSVAGTQVLTFTAGAGAINGVSAVTVTGTSAAYMASTTIALNVEAANAQTITFADPGTQTVGTPLTLVATASSGLAVSFTSSTMGVCTVSGTAATFLMSGNCTITASQAGDSNYAAAAPVSQTFLVTTVGAVPVPASADVIVSQVNWLHLLNGNAITSNNPAGGSIAVNANGQIAAGTGSGFALTNVLTGVQTSLGSWSGAGPAAVDSSNNLYLGNLYSSAPIVKLPYVGGTANGGYAAFTAPTGTTPACTGTSTTECTIAAAGAVNVGAITLDAAGDLFWVTAYGGSGANAIYECTVACLAGTGTPVMLYQEPAATTAPSPTSGQLLVGAIAVDPMGNLFFTDSSMYVNTANYQYTSFASNLKELPKSAGGYATLPTVLYSETPASIAAYNNEIDAVAVNATTGTVYFADQNNGVLAFPNSGTAISTANGQPTALYTVSAESAKILTVDGPGNLYFEVYSSSLGSGDTIGQSTSNSVTVPSSATGTAVSPSNTLNPVTTILNDGSCSATPAPAVTFLAGASTTAAATVTAGGTCSSTVSGGATFATTVSFTPSAGGNDSVTVTGTDQLNNTGTVTVSGVGQATVMAQTITFANPGAQSVGTSLALTATASSGLAVSFSSATTSVCTVSGATATLLTAGTCTIDANQAGNGSYSAAAQVQQSFAVNPAPSYTLAATTSTVSVVQGASSTDSVTVTPAYGFTGSVTLAATGLPTGVTASFGTNPATGSSLLTLTAGAAAALGTTTVTITGTSGTLTASTVIAVTVTPAASFTLTPAAATVSVVEGLSATDTINVSGMNGFTGSVTLAATGLPAGVTATFGTNPATGSSVLTLTASATAATGTAAVIVTGTSGSLTASTTVALTVTAPSSFTLAPATAAVSVLQGASATDTINVSGVNGFAGSVMLAASGLPAGVTATFGTNPATASSVVTFTASGAAATGTTTITITGTSNTGTSGSLSATTTVALTVGAAPGITVSAASATVTLSPGQSMLDVFTIAGTNGFSGSVTLAAVLTSSPQGAIDAPTVSFGTTSPVNVALSVPGAATLTIGTTPATTGALKFPAHGTSPFAYAGGAAMACLLLFVLPGKRRRLPATLALIALLCAVGGMAGCGGGSGGGSTGGNSGTTAGNYTVTVTATAGTIVQTTEVTVVVQ